jgi:hypothetical protein
MSGEPGDKRNEAQPNRRRSLDSLSRELFAAIERLEADFVRELADRGWRDMIRLWALVVLCCAVGQRLAALLTDNGPPSLSFNAWPAIGGFIGMVAGYLIERRLRISTK